MRVKTAQRDKMEYNKITEIADEQSAYYLLMRIHDRIWSSYKTLDLETRLNSCSLIWRNMLEIRNRSDWDLFNKLDDDMQSAHLIEVS